jgi:hypothetical protein
MENFFDTPSQYAKNFLSVVAVQVCWIGVGVDVDVDVAEAVSIGALKLKFNSRAFVSPSES